MIFSLPSGWRSRAHLLSSGKTDERGKNNIRQQGGSCGKTGRTRLLANQLDGLRNGWRVFLANAAHIARCVLDKSVSHQGHRVIRFLLKLDELDTGRCRRRRRSRFHFFAKEGHGDLVYHAFHLLCLRQVLEDVFKSRGDGHAIAPVIHNRLCGRVSPAILRSNTNCLAIIRPLMRNATSLVLFVMPSTILCLELLRGGKTCDLIEKRLPCNRICLGVRACCRRSYLST